MHIGVIMDGNGRWAQVRRRPRTFGHIKGARVAKRIITRCTELGVGTLTLFAFSTENWLRPQEEVTFLMSLLKRYLSIETATLLKQNIRFTSLGDPSRLPQDLQDVIRNTEAVTANNTGLHLVFAVNYGGRAEIAQSARRLAEKVLAGEMTVDQINETTLGQNLQTVGDRDPDLIIRTSGESRISNFLLWQVAYSEFYFTPTLWPDFTEEDLMEALGNFSRRERRYGRVNSDEKPLEI